ncbi:Primosome PriB/single-strand DNA-binding protein [Macrophomina phaseolina MS6]|uniref:Primosome PriB/single-strand DNA-binding protein n=1 Tax=Macrophomina phaseolina (strain MS6) TaxID=1126212 RepID=K2S005_MACPH|nr:Primosome PriB/single-strand DNA-binding protein [Macrophomina phaseolina MS6]
MPPKRKRDEYGAEEGDFVRLERAIAKVAADEVEALDAISKLTSELRAASSRLERSRKQKVLLQRRGGLMLNKKV